MTLMMWSPFQYLMSLTLRLEQDFLGVGSGGKRKRKRKKERVSFP